MNVYPRSDQASVLNNPYLSIESSCMPGLEVSKVNPQRSYPMNDPAQELADQRAAALQERRDAYVQAKVAAHTSETGKKPTKKQTDEWAEKAIIVVV